MMVIIVDRLNFTVYCILWTLQKTTIFCFLVVRALSLSKGDRHCNDLVMAKTLKILQFPVKPSVGYR